MTKTISMLTILTQPASQYSAPCWQTRAFWSPSSDGSGFSHGARRFPHNEKRTPLLLFFFLRGERLLYRPCAADPFIDFDEGSLQLAIVPKGLDLALGLALCRRRCEALGDCLAIHLVGQPQMRAVAWIIGAVAMATGVAATATGAGNRTRAKITQLRNLSQDCVSLILQIGERLGHKRPPLPSVSYTLGNAAQIRKPAFRPLSRRGPFVALPLQLGQRSMVP